MNSSYNKRLNKFIRQNGRVEVTVADYVKIKDNLQILYGDVSKLSVSIRRGVGFSARFGTKTNGTIDVLLGRDYRVIL